MRAIVQIVVLSFVIGVGWAALFAGGVAVGAVVEATSRGFDVTAVLDVSQIEDRR